MGVSFDRLVGLGENSSVEEYLLRRDFKKGAFNPVHKYSALAIGFECLYTSLDMTEYFLNIYFLKDNLYFEVIDLTSECIYQEIMYLEDKSAFELSEKLDYLLYIARACARDRKKR